MGARRPVWVPFERVDVSVQKPHWVSQSRINVGGKPQSKKHLGMERRLFGSADPKDAVAAPACSFAKLWATAKQHAAPAGARPPLRSRTTGAATSFASTARACSSTSTPRAASSGTSARAE